MIVLGSLSPPDVRGKDNGYAARADGGAAAGAAGERGRAAAESARSHGSHCHAPLGGDTW